MRALMVNGQFYESVREFSRENGIPYYLAAGAFREKVFPLWFLGFFVEEATPEQVARFSGSIPRPARPIKAEAPRVGVDGKRSPLIPSPVTVGISTTWGVS